MKLNLWTLQHMILCLNHGIGRKNQVIKQGKRSKKEPKGCRYARFRWRNFRWRNFRWRSFRWWNFRCRGARWSVRKKCWVFVRPSRLLNFFNECCWCQTDLRDHFLYKHLHRFRLISQWALGLPTRLTCSVLGMSELGRKRTWRMGSSGSARMMCPKSWFFSFQP